MIAKGTLDSSFLKAEIEFIKQNGVTKSRSTSSQYFRFDKASAGYYRNRGSAIILKVLQHEFIPNFGSRVHHEPKDEDDDL
ncbi:hypothetical protein BDC45DRAFT_519069 [Circinella umbellata]|nr:hypothetical protein BDC45DRAFT_519069 [Circinella umbellata]